MTSRAPPFLLLVFLLLLVAAGIGRNETRYLASDQFAYLVQARAFASGRLFPTWPPWDVLGSRLRHGERADLFHFSTVGSNDGLRTRYSPGFPMLLALAGALGRAGPFLVAPLFFIGLIVVVRGTIATLTSSHPERAWLALSGIALILHLPSQIHLWSLSPLRDIPAHALALGGLLLLLRNLDRPGAGIGRSALAGALLGFAVSVRPDAISYFLSAGALLAAGCSRPGSRPRRFAAALAGALLGVLPLVAYEQIAWGGLFASPQMAEFGEIRAGSAKARPAPADAPAAKAPSPAAGNASPAVRPGAIRFGNLRWMLPKIARLATSSFGAVLLTLAGVGAVWAALRERRALLVVLPYGLASILFHGMWGRLSPRYLAGLVVCFGILAMLGAAVLLDAGAEAGRRLDARARHGIALGAALVSALVLARERGLGAPGVLEIEALLFLAAALSPILSARPHRISPAALLALALVLDAAVRVGTAPERPRFGPKELAAATRAFEGTAAPHSMVLVAGPGDLAAENIDYYTGAHALPAADLPSLGWSLPEAAAALLDHGYPVYLLATGGSAERGEVAGDPAAEIVAAGLRASLAGTKEGPDAALWFVRPESAEEGGGRAVLWKLDRGDRG